MINIGKQNKLKIVRDSDIGLFLGDESGNEVLLPNKYCPSDSQIGDKLEVFIYTDKKNRIVATTNEPNIQLHEFAYMKVESKTEAGIFLDWGIEKQLFVPKIEQKEFMDIGNWYFIYLLIDENTNKLYGTNKIERYIEHDHLSVKKGDKVDLLIYEDAGIGYSVIINNIHKGMIYKNEIFRDLEFGQNITGYIKNIREDKKIDVSLQPIGYRNFNDPNCELILTVLNTCDGFIPLTDKSSPEDIYKSFEISKKSFKKSIGALYKQKRIEILENGIRIVNKK